MHHQTEVVVETKTKPAVVVQEVSKAKNRGFHSNHKPTIFEGIFSSLFRISEAIRQKKSRYSQPFVFKQSEKVRF